MNDLQKKLKEAIDKYGSDKNQFLRARIEKFEPELYGAILEYSKFLNVREKVSFAERCYVILNGITALSLCSVCRKNPVSFVSKAGKRYYSDTCSIQCSNKTDHKRQSKSESLKKHWSDPDLKRKTLAASEQTNLKKYGTRWATQSEEVKTKTEKTCIEKYGVRSFAETDSFKKKAEASKIEKFGEDYNRVIARKSADTRLKYDDAKKQEIQEKRRNTNIARYGDQNFVNKEQIAQTVRSGVESDPDYYAKIIKKRRQTNLETHGCSTYVNVEKRIKTIKQLVEDNPDYYEGINSSRLNTIKERYGVENFTKILAVAESMHVSSGKRAYNNYILTSIYDKPLFTLDEFLARSSSDELLAFQCLKCGKMFKAKHDNGHHSHCPECYPTDKISYKEIALRDYIKNELGFDCIENSRTVIAPYELDIFIPEKRIAVEFDGLHWHDSEHRPKKYHLEKTELCEKAGIRLIHVFENEWDCKNVIVKSRLKNILGIPGRTIYARKCEIKEVQHDEAKKFQIDNHLQGYTQSQFQIGLYESSELVSLMTFSKPRFDKNHEWELVRFCNKIDCHIIGGASRLLKYFERTKNPQSLVSYADRRWSAGDIYEKLGFSFKHASGPNYWYFKTSEILESRLKYQKKNLKELLETYDQNLSEKANMLANGYHMIYDCGNLVFEKTYSNI